MCDGSCSDIGGSHYPYQCEACDQRDEDRREAERQDERLDRIERMVNKIAAHLGLDPIEE